MQYHPSEGRTLPRLRPVCPENLVACQHLQNKYIAAVEQKRDRLAMVIKKAIAGLCVHPTPIITLNDAMAVKNVGEMLGPEIIRGINKAREHLSQTSSGKSEFITANENGSRFETSSTQDTIERIQHQSNVAQANKRSRGYHPEPGKPPWAILLALARLNGEGTKTNIVQKCTELNVPCVIDSWSSSIKSLKSKGLLQVADGMYSLHGDGVPLARSIFEASLLIPSHSNLAVTTSSSSGSSTIRALTSFVENGYGQESQTSYYSTQDTYTQDSEIEYSQLIQPSLTHLRDRLQKYSSSHQISSYSSSSTSNRGFVLDLTADEIVCFQVPSDESINFHVIDYSEEDPIAQPIMNLDDDPVSGFHTTVNNSLSSSQHVLPMSLPKYNTTLQSSSTQQTSALPTSPAVIQAAEGLLLRARSIRQTFAQQTPISNFLNSESDHDVAVLDSSEWEVVLVVDQREKDRALIQSKLMDNSLPCAVCTLAVGDFLFVARPKATGYMTEAIVLDVIAERKTFNDLMSSIVDGRYEEQKSRLKGCRIRSKIYLVEGVSHTPSVANNQKTASVRTAMLSVQVETDLQVIRTRNIDHTIDFFKAMFRQVSRRFSREQRGTKHQSYNEFQREFARKQIVTVGQLFGHQLRQIPGCSGSVVTALIEKYGTLANMIRSLQTRGSENAKMDLQSLKKVGTTNGRIGPKLAETIWKLLCERF